MPVKVGGMTGFGVTDQSKKIGFGGAPGKRRQLLLSGKVRRCCLILARACEAHLIERIVAVAKLDWEAALGY